MLLEAEHLVRRQGDRDVVAGVTLALAPGESVALTGPSGSGKTSLLQLLGLLDRPTSGRVLYADRTVDAWAASAGTRAALRLAHVGFVFQRGNLLPHLAVEDNVALPALRLGAPVPAARARARELLARFALLPRAHDQARTLSPGEAQRAAIARALVNRPALVLADEPTGSLDSRAAAVVWAALAEIRALGSTLLVVTHDEARAAGFDRHLRLVDGRLTAPI